MHAKGRKLGWISGAAAFLAVVSVVHGCGSDSSSGEQPPATGGSGGDASSGDVSQDGLGGTGGGDAKIEVNPKCSLNGTSCVGSADCCSANCDAQTKMCTNPPGVCLQPGEACTAGPECCSIICAGGVCGSGVCISDNQPCTDAASCCSGKCGTGSTCTPLNPECKTVGNECAANAECCSKFCLNGHCSGQPSFCTQVGEACITDFECCTGICTKQGTDNIGLCTQPTAPGATGCLAAGIVCGGGAVSDAGGIPACGGDCCSRSCAPYGPTGVLVCQPPSGCRPTGEICKSDSDCCGSPGMPGGNGSVTCSKTPGEPVGRCDNGNACRAAGAVCKLATSSCNAENNCCAGNVNQDPTVCQQDLLGIPRCTGAGNCADAGSYEGKECASSADCCGLACVPNKSAVDGGAPFICGSTTCVPAGGDCTTDADCCPGLPCVAPPGSTHGICGAILEDGGVPDANVPDGPLPEGQVPDAAVPDTGPTCALYGQTCTAASDCCNNVPCTQGRCLYPIY
ncbi:MAG: hypothetical protein HY898_05580 [Deltaproteobacteria bacterium]|nr:hypothetical protein [Deltaproteobacteria bacterium]